METGFRMIDELLTMIIGHFREATLIQIIKLRQIFTILVYLTNARILYVTKEPKFVLPKI